MDRKRSLLPGLVVDRGVRPQPTPKPPQEWQLAAKRQIVATRLVRDRKDNVGRFLLGLSLAYNDLKGLVMFEQYLVAMGRPKPDDFSPYAGQWRGVTVQIQRWIAGVLHEIMNVIASPKNRAVLKGPEFPLLVARIGKANQEAWNNLVTVAQAPMNKLSMTTLLHRIRNWTAFHYGGTNLADAYADLFTQIAGLSPSEANLAAQVSLGADMDGTRFYYADAAAQQVMQNQLLAHGTTLDEVFEIAQQVNLALAALLRAFIDLRDQ